MPRRRRPETREILPDPVYGSTLAEKFVNSMMWDGKKAIAQKIFYEAMDKIQERTQDDPLKLFKKAVDANGDGRISPLELAQLRKKQLMQKFRP